MTRKQTESTVINNQMQQQIQDLEKLILEKTEALEEKQEAFEELYNVFKQAEEENKNLCNDLNEVHRIIREQDELIKDRE